MGLTLPATHSSSDELSSSSPESSESKESTACRVLLGRGQVRDTRHTDRGGPHPPRGLHSAEMMISRDAAILKNNGKTTMDSNKVPEETERLKMEVVMADILLTKQSHT
ncbi:hypothetical protein DPEC_G00247770 [Dallia pectoralis]|uniref:Uncharacterized protein n=1 Tax=Dallia pectoralis TaxID=75939 RepID=A0ACC2FWG1_DALPE|nr:hypothetical protein DPEC_G00247770 [Dallia pectoralis]